MPKVLNESHPKWSSLVIYRVSSLVNKPTNKSAQNIMTITDYHRSQKEKGASITSFFNVVKKESLTPTEANQHEIALKTKNTAVENGPNPEADGKNAISLDRLNLDTSSNSMLDYSNYSKETLEKIKSKITKLSSALKVVERESTGSLDNIIQQDIANFKKLHQTKSIKYE